MENKITEFEINAMLIQIDELESEVAKAKEINDRYDSIKEKIKGAMLKIGKENNLEQVKWITPNNTQITCSIGKKAIWDTEIVNEFDVNVLKEKYPQIYEECVVAKEKKVQVQSSSNDTLRITLPKGGK